MAEARSLTLPPRTVASAAGDDARRGNGWTFLGSTPEKAAVEAVLRSFDTTVEFATGSTSAHPDGPPTQVRPGEGARLSGHHFFVRPVLPGVPGRILVRGV